MPHCECPRCTYHNDVEADECGVCGFSFLSADERQILSSGNGNQGGGQCVTAVAADEQWRCASCTYENDRHDSHCQVCHQVRPPLQAYNEQLIDDDDDDNVMHEMSADGPSAAQAWAGRSGRADTDFDEADFPTSLASSMLLGAGIGAGLAWLNRSDVSSGALAGAGLGAAGDMALREVAAAQRMRQLQQLQQRRAMERQFGAANRPPVSSFEDDEDVFGGMHRSIAARRAAAPAGSLNTDGMLMQAVLSSLVSRRTAAAGGARPGSAFGSAFEVDVDRMPFEALLERFPAPPRGVDPATLHALPVRPYVQPSAPPTPSAGGRGDSSSSSSSNTGGGESASEQSCSICMEQYARGDEVKTLPCLHCFHAACVDRWLREHHTCPVCKHSLT